MADKKPEMSEEDQNAMMSALSYGSVWLHPFFTHQYGGTQRFNRGPVNIRFNMSSVYWGSTFVLITALILKLLRAPFHGDYPIILSTPAFIVFLATALIIGWRLAGWSPMSKSTGEGFNEWIKLKIQRFFADGRYKGHKLRKTYVYTRQRMKDGKPRLIEARQYIGTVPSLWTAPADPDHPYDPEDPDHTKVQLTDYFLVPRGQYILYDPEIIDEADMLDTVDVR